MKWLIPIPLPGCCPKCLSDNTGAWLNVQWGHVTAFHVCREDACDFYRSRDYTLDWQAASSALQTVFLIVSAAVMLWALVSLFALIGQDEQANIQITEQGRILP